MSSSISEEKKNPVVTLKAQAEKFNFSKLRADKGNAGANSGYQAYQDIDRMNFVINKKNIDTILIKALINRDKEEFDKFWEKYCGGLKVSNDKETDRYKEEVEKFYNIGKGYTNLLPKEGDENKSYRPFVKEVFKEIFKHAKAQVPSDYILEELVTNCNQAGYEAGIPMELQDALGRHSFVTESPKKVINIDHISQNNVNIRSNMTLPILFQKSDGTIGDKICDLPNLLEFTLESQDGKDGVTHKDGKLSITVPQKLKDYKIDGRNLFDIIKEYFYKFCEKLGFKFETEIEHNFEEEDSLYEDEKYSFEGTCLVFNEQPENYVKDPDVDHLSNKRGTPGVNN